MKTKTMIDKYYVKRRSLYIHLIFNHVFLIAYFYALIFMWNFSTILALLYSIAVTYYGYHALKVIYYFIYHKTPVIEIHKESFIFRGHVTENYVKTIFFKDIKSINIINSAVKMELYGNWRDIVIGERWANRSTYIKEYEYYFQFLVLEDKEAAKKAIMNAFEAYNLSRFPGIQIKEDKIQYRNENLANDMKSIYWKDIKRIDFSDDSFKIYLEYGVEEIDLHELKGKDILENAIVRAYTDFKSADGVSIDYLEDGYSSAEESVQWVSEGFWSRFWK